MGLLTGVVGGCAGSAPTKTAVPEAAPNWSRTPLLEDDPNTLEALEAAARGDLADRIWRLDHLLDLFDAARFTEHEVPRELLWAALGGHGVGVGVDATREAQRRLLQEALALEDEATRSGLDEDRTRWIADVIMLLTNDLQQPGRAEDLSIRNLAYRTLIEQGHPRVADNARWRIYDHVRGTLRGAVEVAPRHRMTVAVQALYAERDDVDPWLEDVAAHAKPPWPSPEALWKPLAMQAEALAELERWAPVIERVQEADADLRDTVMAQLPAPRDPDWPMPEAPTGTAENESLAPVVLVGQGRVVVDAGRPQARTLPSSDDIEDLADAIQSALAQDGRGTIALAAAPLLPSPELHRVLRAFRRAGVARLEIGIREPRLDGERPVVRALPVVVARSTDATAGAAALLDAPIAVHLAGRGPRFAIEDQWISDEAHTPGELRAVLSKLRRAYPRARIARVTLDSDVVLAQWVDVLVALRQAGDDGGFEQVGWWAGGAPPQGGPSPEADQRLAHRLAWSWPDPDIRLDQPYPFAAPDQTRLEDYVGRLSACLPELQVPTPKQGGQATFVLSFEEGRLRDVGLDLPSSVQRRATRAKTLESTTACAKNVGFALRLRAHRDPVVVRATLRPG